jgi:hypothetical protein
MALKIDDQTQIPTNQIQELLANPESLVRDLELVHTPKRRRAEQMLNAPESLQQSISPLGDTPISLAARSIAKDR